MSLFLTKLLFIYSLLCCFFVSGAFVPTGSACRKKGSAAGRGDQPSERCRGHTLRVAAGPAPGSRVSGEDESGFPVGHCQRVSCSLSIKGKIRRIIIDMVFVGTNIVNEALAVCDISN